MQFTGSFHLSLLPSLILVSGNSPLLALGGRGSQCSGDCQPFLGLRVVCVWSSQLGRRTGPPLLQFLLDLLRHLVIHCQQLDAQNQQKCQAAQAESDLFLDVESMASLELADDKVPPPFLPGSPSGSPFPVRSQSLAFPPFWLKASTCSLQGSREVQRTPKEALSTIPRPPQEKHCLLGAFIFPGTSLLTLALLRALSLPLCRERPENSDCVFSS